MQNFLSNHSSIPFYSPASSYFAGVSGTTVPSLAANTVECIVRAVSAAAGGFYLTTVALAEVANTSTARVEHLVSTAGSLLTGDASFTGFIYRMELPIGTAPQAITYPTLQNGVNMFAVPLHFQPGTNCISWKDTCQLDLRPIAAGHDVYYGVAIGLYHATDAPIVTGLISSRDVNRDLRVYQPNKG